MKPNKNTRKTLKAEQPINRAYKREFLNSWGGKRFVQCCRAEHHAWLAHKARIRVWEG